MIYKNFRFNVILRVLVLSATSLAFTYLITSTSMYASSAMVALIFVYLLYGLIVYVEKSNRTMSRFLQAIEFDDFTQSFGNVTGGSTFAELNQAFAQVSARFREIRLEREENYRYLQAVVQHVGVGMIAYSENGEVELYNTAAKRILQFSTLRNIEALDRISPALKETITSLKSGQRDLVTVLINGEMVQLSLLMSTLRMRDRKITLVSFQNIAAELNEKEMEAWQNLIRVLTHEIKNSLTPIASLAATIETILTPISLELSDESKDNIVDILEALRTIRNRSQGLHEFVNAYRDLTNLPRPKIELTKVTELLDRVELLIKPQIDAKRISYRRTVRPESLQIMVDPQMIEQVLINLLLNSLHALGEAADSLIEIRVYTDERGHPAITVIDNGPGIVPKAIEKIFIPFFTTRKGGSGIGLSLSRQIMRRHRGELTVRSEPDKETAFTMRF